MKIIGVGHTIFDRVGNIIRSVKPVVEKLREQNISGNAGIEQTTIEYDENLLRKAKEKRQSYDRFWKAIVLHLRRRGTEKALKEN